MQPSQGPAAAARRVQCSTGSTQMDAGASFLSITMASRHSCTTESGVEAPEVTPILAGRSSGKKSLATTMSPSTLRHSIELSGRMHLATLTWYDVIPASCGISSKWACSEHHSAHGETQSTAIRSGMGRAGQVAGR